MTIIVPSFNERDNVEPLVDAMAQALGNYDVSVLYVDDSTDGTEAMVAAMAPRVRFPLRVIHRDRPVGGLSGAVVLGIEASSSDVILVCDGDGQHPPTLIPEMLDVLAREPRVDIVVASRYRPGGDAGGLSSGVRHAVSSGATWLARGMFPRRLRGCTDPMTGFFAVRRSALDVTRLDPIGFKILLEILATHDLRIREVPLRFGTRESGESKASMRQGTAFLRQLLALRFGRARR